MICELLGVEVGAPTWVRIGAFTVDDLEHPRLVWDGHNKTPATLMMSAALA
jgi:hypothetical protein